MIHLTFIGAPMLEVIWNLGPYSLLLHHADMAIWGQESEYFEE